MTDADIDALFVAECGEELFPFNNDRSEFELAVNQAWYDKREGFRAAMQSEYVKGLERDAKVAAFGARCIEAHRLEIADLDGFWLEETALACGVLETVRATEPCGGNCRCVEYGEFPHECHRYPADIYEAIRQRADEREE